MKKKTYRDIFTHILCMNKRTLLEIDIGYFQYFIEFYFPYLRTKKNHNVEILYFNFFKLSNELEVFNSLILRKTSVASGITSLIAIPILIDLIIKHKINKIIKPKIFIDSVVIYCNNCIDLGLLNTANYYTYCTKYYVESCDINKLKYIFE